MSDEVSRPHRAWLTYLDGWRGLSILAVLAGHFCGIPMINAGRFGVETFFVLSGRLMAGILFVENYPLGAFFYRRIARVWPALYVFLFLLTCVCVWTGSSEIKGIDIIGALTFTSNYTWIYFHQSAILGHLWSLAVEEWAYVLLAAIAFLCRKFTLSPLPALVIVAACCVANGIIQTGMGKDYYSVYCRTDVRIASIFISCAFLLMMRGKSVPQWLPVVAGLLGVALNINLVPDTIKYSLGSTCLAFSISTLDMSPERIKALLSMKWLRMIGLWSFSLYLWQQPFGHVKGPALFRLSMAFLCAIASFYMLENPARRMLNGLLERRRGRMRTT